MAGVQIPIIVQKVDGDGDFVPVSGATVQVNARGGAAQTVYSNEGLSNVLAANGTLTTGADGKINARAWIPEGSYDLVVTHVDITTFTFAFEATRGDAAVALDGTRLVNGSVASGKLTNVDGAKIVPNTITVDKLDTSIVPVGTCIPWYRPNNSTAVPSNWAIADGQELAPGNHDFTGGGTIAVPDLRNRFVLGADNPGATSYRGDNAATIAGDGTSAHGAAHPNAPGIRYAGSTNVKSLSHQHTVPAHYHSFSASTSSSGDHGHGGTTGTAGGSHSHFFPNFWNIPGAVTFVESDTDSGKQGTVSFSGSNYIGGTAPADINHTHSISTSNAGAHTHTVSGNAGTGVFGDTGELTVVAAGSTTQSFYPSYVGLLWLIKVKNS